MRIPVKLFVASLFLCLSHGLTAQTVVDLIKANPAYASCNYNTYPDSIKAVYTPAPAGKKPFYLSHYGRHGSRYISSRSGFDIPFKMVARADSLDELTPMGKRVYQEMKLVMDDTEGRWGELTGYGRKQHRNIARRMVINFPEVFHPKARVQALSTVVPRCIESMGTALMELLQEEPTLQVSQESSQRNQWFMNYQDRQLRSQQMTPNIRRVYNEYINKYMGNSRLMELIFKNPDIVQEVVDEGQFNYYLMKMGLFQLNTHLYKNTFLIDIFQPEELYRLWQTDNALWFAQYANFTPNDGGLYPYTQRHLLRKIINEADSCLHMVRHGAQLRFGHDTVLLPLVCLLGINGYDLRSDNLEEIEGKGWWCSDIFPMASSLQFVFYRSSPKDKDILFKVLLNEQEARLPIHTDCAPYYHWRDFRRHYLKKIDNFEKKQKK